VSSTAATRIGHDSDQRPPRVAYIVSRFPKVTETFVLFEILAVRRHGVDVELYPLWHEKTPAVHPEAVDLVRDAHFGPLLSVDVIRRSATMLVRRPRRVLGALATIIGENLGSPNHLIGGLATFGRALQLADEFERHGIEHVHAHFANHPTTVAFVIHRVTGIPYSFTAHAFDIHVDQHMLASKIREAAFVVPIAEDHLGLFAHVTGGGFEDKVHVIHCGVDTSVFQARDDPGARSRTHDLEVLQVGSLTPLKGHAVLIDACRELVDAGVDVHVRIVGDGPLRTDVTNRIEAAGLGDRIELLGALDRAAIARLHHDVDVLVAPSVPTKSGKREGIPVVLMEAMASGLPVVASRLSGIPELVIDGVTGALVTPGDASALAGALRRLANDPAVGEAWGRAGRDRVIEGFDLDRNAARLAACFRETVGARQVHDPEARPHLAARPGTITPPSVASSSGMGPASGDPS
jgi:colanic acid/amylovoran biosynthesis glycosyltransferase